MTEAQWAILFEHMDGWVEAIATRRRNEAIAQIAVSVVFSLGILAWGVWHNWRMSQEHKERMRQMDEEHEAAMARIRSAYR